MFELEYIVASNFLTYSNNALEEYVDSRKGCFGRD
jgi:hypothetical protein